MGKTLQRMWSRNLFGDQGPFATVPNGLRDIYVLIKYENVRTSYFFFRGGVKSLVHLAVGRILSKGLQNVFAHPATRVSHPMSSDSEYPGTRLRCADKIMATEHIFWVSGGRGT